MFKLLMSGGRHFDAPLFCSRALQSITPLRQRTRSRFARIGPVPSTCKRFRSTCAHVCTEQSKQQVLRLRLAQRPQTPLRMTSREVEGWSSPTPFQDVGHPCSCWTREMQILRFAQDDIGGWCGVWLSRSSKLEWATREDVQRMLEVAPRYGLEFVLPESQ